VVKFLGAVREVETEKNYVHNEKTKLTKLGEKIHVRVSSTPIETGCGPTLHFLHTLRRSVCELSCDSNFWPTGSGKL